MRPLGAGGLTCACMAVPENDVYISAVRLILLICVHIF